MHFFCIRYDMAGRPRKDNIDTQNLIINLASKGMSTTDIAEVTGLALRTIQYWLADTDLGKTVKAVRMAAVELEARQKAALNKSALLAAKKLLKKRKSVEIEKRTDADGKLLYTVERTKEIEPNAGIVQFVLKNTDPGNWSDDRELRQQTDSEEDSEITINIVDGASNDD